MKYHCSPDFIFISHSYVPRNISGKVTVTIRWRVVRRGLWKSALWQAYLLSPSLRDSSHIQTHPLICIHFHFPYSTPTLYTAWHFLLPINLPVLLHMLRVGKFWSGGNSVTVSQITPASPLRRLRRAHRLALSLLLQILKPLNRLKIYNCILASILHAAAIF